MPPFRFGVSEPERCETKSPDVDAATLLALRSGLQNGNAAPIAERPDLAQILANRLPAHPQIPGNRADVLTPPPWTTYRPE
jgi:hypothetical protein